MTASPSPSVVAGSRTLPLVVFFTGDEATRRALEGIHRYRKMAFERSDGQIRGTDCVVVTSVERLISENYSKFRTPNVRIIALSEHRFHDPRVDGAIYAYLPPQASSSIVERIIDNALDHIHLLNTRRDVNERLQGATREINELNQIGAALSAEHDTEKLLEMILTKMRQITRSDAGSLYIVETEEVAKEGAQGGPEEKAKEIRRKLRFKLAQNDSVSIPFRERLMDISKTSIAGYVALTAEPVNLEDAYQLPDDVPYSINRKFDEDSGYRTKSILAVPMMNQKSEVLGVVQLLNAKHDWDARLTAADIVDVQVVPYTHRQQEIVASLASQAAVAFENSQLYAAIQKLFEGFVRASVIAIEARDPTTSGHSFRVANLTVGLAEAVDRCEEGAYKEISFSRSEMKEIRYASLLHDFGKVGVREEVLVKAKKLYPSQMDLIQERFQFVKRTLEAEASRRKLEYALEKGREQFLAQVANFDKELADQLAALDKQLSIVLQSNEPTVLPEGSFEHLTALASTPYFDWSGQQKTLLNGDEVRLLSIRKGSLDDTERKQIESHVVHTFNFLKQIPWTREIRAIPAIARGHHEKLNGRGYPYGLAAVEIPIQTRMMTISDIFDALAAADRPYKKAVNTDRALEILGFAVKDGELDKGLFQVFLDSKVYERWKVEPFPY